MEQWALVLADSVLLVVALAGALLTLVRIRRVGGLAAVLAGAACGVLLVAAIFDMVWWTQVYPTAFDADDVATATTLNNLGVLGTTLTISIGVGLLIVATNVGRPAAAEPRTAPPGLQPTFLMGAPQGTQTAPPNHQIPHQQIPQQQAPYQVSQQAQQQVPQQQAQPTAGWTPPQQTQAGDWNIHSGVWSIPRGTFDGPPPDQQQPR